MILNGVASSYWGGIPYSQYDSLNMILPNPWDMMMVFFLPVMLSIGLFRYIQSEKALSTMHSFPVSRKSLFGSHYIAFEIIFMTPVLISAVVSFMLLLGKGFNITVVLTGGVFLYILIMFICATAFFSITTMFGMLVGSSVLQAALTYIMMLVPFAVTELSKMILSWLLRGYYAVFDVEKLHYYLTPYFTVASLVDNTDMTIWLMSFISIVLMMILSAALSYILYQRRDLERHTELISFSFAKVGFVIIMTVTSTITLAASLGSMLGGDDPFGAYVGVFFGALIGFAVTMMIATKTINILPVYKKWIAVVVSFVLLLVVVDMDLVGYESHIPKKQDVVGVTYSMQGGNNRYDNFSPMLFNDDSIEAVMQLHQGFIDDVGYNLVRNGEAQRKSVTIDYFLENGKTIRRRYRDNIEHKYLNAVHELDEIKLGHIDRIKGLINEEDAVLRIVDNADNEMIISGDIYDEFIEIYTRDYIQLGYFEEDSGMKAAMVQLSYGEERKDGMGSSYSSLHKVNLTMSPPSFEETLKWLEDNGYEAYLPKKRRCGEGVDL